MAKFSLKSRFKEKLKTGLKAAGVEARRGARAGGKVISVEAKRRFEQFKMERTAERKAFEKSRIKFRGEIGAKKARASLGLPPLKKYKRGKRKKRPKYRILVIRE